MTTACFVLFEEIIVWVTHAMVKAIPRKLKLLWVVPVVHENSFPGRLLLLNRCRDDVLDSPSFLNAVALRICENIIAVYSRDLVQTKAQGSVYLLAAFKSDYDYEIEYDYTTFEFQTNDVLRAIAPPCC